MIILFGPQGSGKGTQTELLITQKGWHSLATGNMLRDSVDPEIHRRLEVGELIDDELTNAMLAAELSRLEPGTEVILDGYPRNIDQARWLLANVGNYRMQITCAIQIDIPTDESVARLLARRRTDDTKEAIERRLEIYHNATEPIIDFYRSRGVPCAKVNGLGSVEEVHQRVERALASCVPE